MRTVLALAFWLYVAAAIAGAPAAFSPYPAVGERIGAFLLPKGHPETIVLDGDLTEGAPLDFRRALKARPSATKVILNSDGGYVTPGLLIALDVHDRKMATEVPLGSGCYSACAFIYFAGVRRRDDGSLGVHQIYGEQTTPESTQFTLSDILDALQEFGVRQEVVSIMLRTPPSDIHVFTNTEIERFGINSATATGESTADAAAAVPSKSLPPPAAIDPASVAGSQSMLLEAQDNGTTGAVPFSGTVDWSKGVDENGQPTLVGKANIPARNLQVEVLIRKNADPSLTASHLMEINFTVSDSFIGGSIAGLPGVLLKDEELTQGTPLVGASARVVGNSFLFALSAAPEDSATNVNLLTGRKWMDLALIYASGKRAIITLEKDDKAQKLFSDVFASWSTSVSEPNGVGVTVVPKNATADDVALGRQERILRVDEAIALATILKKNGFTKQMIDAISTTLKNVYPDPVLPAHARLRILFGPSRTPDTLIPYRLSIYVHDDASNSDKHAATVALTDSGTYALGLPPSPIDGEQVASGAGDQSVIPTDGRSNRAAPPLDLGM